MDLRTWTENPVKNEGKKKVSLDDVQIQRAADVYHTWQTEGTDGMHYEVPELYRSVGIAEIEKQGWSLVPSKYIEFVDHDLEIDFGAEMSRIQAEMRDILAQEKQSHKLLEDAFRGDWIWHKINKEKTQVLLPYNQKTASILKNENCIRV